MADIREMLRAKGATDAQLNAKVVTLIEEVLAEMSDEDARDIGVKQAIEVRDSLTNKILQLEDVTDEFVRASKQCERVKTDAVNTTLMLQDLISPLKDFLRKHPTIGDLGDTMKTIALYKGMLEATKEVFGEELNDDVMRTAIEAASYSSWRSMPDNSNHTYQRR